MNRKLAVLSALVLVALSAFLTACGGGGSDATASGDGGGGSETTTIRYQESSGIISPLEVANALGYLGNLQIKSVGSVIGGPQDIQAVATDSSDIGGAFNGSIVNAVAAGAPVKAVVGYYGSDKYSYEGLYVLDDSSIRSPKDLVGKKIGVNTLGANAEAVIDLWLKQGGLSQSEIEGVEMVVIPTPNAEQALREGQLDGVMLNGYVRDLALSRGGIRPLFKDTDLLGPYTAGSLVLRPDFIEENPKTTATLVGGIAKAIDYLQTAPVAKVVQLADKIATEKGRDQDPESLKYWKSQGVAEKGGVISEKDFTTWIDWLEEEGKLEKGKVTASDVYTNEFNPFAKGGAAAATKSKNGS